MARERLTSKTADEAKVAVEMDKGSGINNDPYTVNNPDHEKNDPKMDQYMGAGDGPSTWAEDVNKDNMWKKDDKSRDPETNHPLNPSIKAAAEAVKTAQKLEQKAVKCIVAAQRILPGAGENVIQAQSIDLMFLPEQSVNALLSRQEELAQSIGKAASESVEEVEAATDAQKEQQEKFKAMIEEKKKEKEAAELAAKKASDELAALEAGDVLEVEAAKKDEDEDKKEEKEATEDKKEEEEDKKEDKKEEEEDKKEEKEATEDKKEEDKKEEEKPLEIEASSNDSLLDDIFSSVTASDNKVGAKTLSGMVKKEASEGSGDMSNLWSAPPDVSEYFG